MSKDIHPIEEGINKLKNILRWVVIIWLFCWMWDTIKQIGKKPIEVGTHWTNIDPSRPVTDISSLDYTNRTVTYREYGASSSTSKVINPLEYKTIINTPSKKVEIDLTPEEVLEQLNLEYEDVRDYYGDELR